jgi:hypothetical protein
VRVGSVQLVEVDPVGAQALEARLDRLHDVAAGRAPERAGLVHRQAELGREHDLLAPVAENAPQRLLRAAAVAVAVGSIDQIDSARHRRVHHALGRRKIDTAAEIIAAEPDDGHVEHRIAEPALLHRR